MCVLAIRKLQEIESFSTMFLDYGLLAKRWVRYGHVYPYPYGELLAGVLMVSGSLIRVASPVAIFIGAIGAWSVFKAVHVDKRQPECACVGGNSRVPLGFHGAMLTGDHHREHHWAMARGGAPHGH